MNRLIIIGNGFDLAHGLKTSYKDFINWYWDQRVESFIGNESKISRDCLCSIYIKNNINLTWNLFSYQNHYFKDSVGNRKCTGFEVIQTLKNDTDTFDLTLKGLFKRIIKSIETKGWVDIENDYYQLLKNNLDNPRCDFSIKELNEQLLFLQNKLVEYLKTLPPVKIRKDLRDKIIGYFKLADFSTVDYKKVINDIGSNVTDLEDIKLTPEILNFIPKRIQILSFNYTNTARLYENFNIAYNFIHGELIKPEKIIFGYGDELDKDYHDIREMNDNELLKNVKSVKYLETSHYKNLLRFLQSGPFQVFIMGHSCGNSDRTLLNTVFEHENCVSIKPFYYVREDGTDNYLELVQNISRNFTDMKKFRDRVVNKELCETL